MVQKRREKNKWFSVSNVVDPDPLHFDNLDPHQIKIRAASGFISK
jgi:hypothetical protein